MWSRHHPQVVVPKQIPHRTMHRDLQTIEPYREWRGARSPKLAEKMGRRATFDWAVSRKPFTVAAERGSYGFSIATDWNNRVCSVLLGNCCEPIKPANIRCMVAEAPHQSKLVLEWD